MDELYMTDSCGTDSNSAYFAQAEKISGEMKGLNDDLKRGNYSDKKRIKKRLKALEKELRKLKRKIKAIAKEQKAKSNQQKSDLWNAFVKSIPKILVAVAGFIFGAAKQRAFAKG